MKFSVVALVASVVAVASAIDYPFAAEPKCIADCKMEAGKKIMADYTLDPQNPKFMESQAIEMVKGTPNYTRFMSESGMCMSKCTQEEQQAYMKDFAARREWYQKQTGTGGAPSGTSPSGSAPSSQPSGKPDDKKSESAASMLTVSGFAAAAAGAVAVALF
ncbi:hypothetical protein BGW41_006708 [Actinomortierella wolfii]|nr:hypothetical protein BGW41_006708 [Actinomortierella wolfii]